MTATLVRRAVEGRRTTGIERAAFAVLAIALLVASVANDWGVFYPDTKPEIYLAPEQALQTFVSTWQPSPKQAGLPVFDVGAAPVAAVMVAARATGAPPWLLVRLWRFLLLCIAAWGAVRLLDRLTESRLHAAGRVAAAAAYTVNPYVIIQGTTTAVLLPYALFPWILIAFDRAIDERGWRWPSAFALILFAMTGMNAGVIPILLLSLGLPAVVIYRRLADRISTRSILRSMARCGVAGIGVSLYWLVPAALASSTGTAVAEATESTESIALTTSLGESLRLLGMWTLYGRSGDTPFTPHYSSFVTNWAVVLATLLIPLAAIAGAIFIRSRLRVFAVLLLAFGLAGMAAMFPPDDPMPAGAALAWALDHIPGAIAFRTTNKAGPAAALGMSLLAGGTAAAAAGYLSRRGTWLATGALAAAALTLGAASLPMWSGNLYRQPYDIPSYWEDVASALELGDAQSRVLVLPGGNGGNYRWSMRSPDDIFQSLTDREVIARSTVFPSHNAAANLVAAIDTALAEQTLPVGGVSALAGYLGATDVVARNDYRWEEVRAARPIVVTRALRADPGLEEVGSFGPAGVYTAAVGEPGEESNSLDEADSTLPSVVHFQVRDPRLVTRASPTATSLILVGDGDGMVNLVPTGLLDEAPAVRLGGDISPDEAEKLLASGASVVLTDTNRRRTGDINRVRYVWSRTLAANDSLDEGRGPSPTLWPEQVLHQTTARLIGADRVDASPPVFGTDSTNKPQFAFDANPDSAWMTGELGTAKGQWIEISFEDPTEFSYVDLVPAVTEGIRISRVRIITDFSSGSFAVGDEEVQRAEFGRGLTRRIRIEIEETEGNSTGGVGFAEISLPGITTREVVSMPRTLDLLAEDPEAANLLDKAPLTIQMNRLSRLPFDAADDEELNIDREFWLPVSRELEFTASISGADNIPQAAFQSLFTGFAEGAALNPDLCFEVATIDGNPIMARLEGTAWGVFGGEPIELSSCDDTPLSLSAGRHEVASAKGWILDTIRLTSDPGAPRAPEEAPVVAVKENSRTSLSVDVGQADGPYFLNSGRGWDPGWSAEMDGSALGPPLIVDGFAAGWFIEDPAPHSFEVSFSPQRWLLPSFGASVIALLACMFFAVRKERAP